MGVNFKHIEQPRLMLDLTLCDFLVTIISDIFHDTSQYDTNQIFREFITELVNCTA